MRNFCPESAHVGLAGLSSVSIVICEKHSHELLFPPAASRLGFERDKKNNKNATLESTLLPAVTAGWQIFVRVECGDTRAAQQRISVLRSTPGTCLCTRVNAGKRKTEIVKDQRYSPRGWSTDIGGVICQGTLR